MDSKQWFVDVISFEGKKCVKTIGPMASERQADRVDDGMNINLNHEAYYTRVREESK